MNPKFLVRQFEQQPTIKHFGANKTGTASNGIHFDHHHPFVSHHDLWSILLTNHNNLSTALGICLRFELFIRTVVVAVVLLDKIIPMINVFTNTHLE
jgi:hypothetical protein